MSDIIDIIFNYCKIVKNDRTYTDIFDAGREEFIELKDEINKKIQNEPEGDDGIKGEAIDVILCMMDLIHNEGMTKAEFEAYVVKKCEKWKSKYGTDS